MRNNNTTKGNTMTSQEQAEKTREATTRKWEARRARWNAWKASEDNRPIENRVADAWWKTLKLNK